MDSKILNNDISSSNHKGYLYKWTNYLKGYQKRWFVLQNGLLSYYRNQGEMAHICRGTINMVNAKICISDSTSFVISHSSMQTFHLKAPNENDLKLWTSALLLAQKKAQDLLKGCENNESEIDSKVLIEGVLFKLKSHIDAIKKSYDVLNRKSEELQKSIHDLEKEKNANLSTEIALKLKNVKERATVFRVSAANILSASSDYNGTISIEAEKWRTIIDNERKLRQRLENMVEDLAKQHMQLEYRISSSVQYQARNTISGIPEGSGESEVSDEDFYDAFESQEGVFDVTLPSPDINLGVNLPCRDSEMSLEYESDVEDDLSNDSISSNDAGISSNTVKQGVKLFTLNDDVDDNDTDLHNITKTNGLQRLRAARVITSKQRNQLQNMKMIMTASNNHVDQSLKKDSPYSSMLSNNATFAKIPIRSKQVRRTQIPAKPNISMNLWSVVKNCIGKDLSKIPMPVNFSEPISMLQRLAEDFQYSSILDKAAKCQSTVEQIAYVAAFTVSSYAATTHRINKPFNPLLGETFEFDRTDDLGWRFFAEQLSHHPPGCAVHCESDEWICWFDFSMTSKFRGKYIQIFPVGKCHLLFKRTRYHYVWEKIPMTIHNIIVGRVWIDNHGEMDIINLTTQDKCHLSHKAYSMFSTDVPRRVTGAITDKNGNVHYVLNGTWDGKLEAKKVVSNTETTKGRKYLEIEETSIQLWQCEPLPDNFERYYCFSEFAVTLNGEEEDVAPTDSRNRPDQRLMEAGKWDEANKEKIRLEETQRNRRCEVIKADGTKQLTYDYKPLWFTTEYNPDTESMERVFNGKYWDCKAKNDWSMCNKIF